MISVGQKVYFAALDRKMRYVVRSGKVQMIDGEVAIVKVKPDEEDGLTALDRKLSELHVDRPEAYAAAIAACAERARVAYDNASDLIAEWHGKK
jgi:hypothetical protein